MGVHFAVQIQLHGTVGVEGPVVAGKFVNELFGCILGSILPYLSWIFNRKNTQKWRKSDIILECPKKSARAIEIGGEIVHNKIN